MSAAGAGARRVALVNPSSGASGDMFLGALVDLGLDDRELLRALRALPLPGLGLEVAEASRGGMRARKVTPVFAGKAPAFRTLGQVTEALRGARGLEPAVAREAERAFARLAEAEARAHGATAGTVHFHELGSADTLVDVVGTVWGWRALGVGRAWCGPVNLGGGTVATEHGLLPVPGPATAALLAGRAVFGEGDGEKTTPTGALLIAHLCEAGAPPPFTLLAAGYGAGDRDFPGRPNCLQVLLGSADGDEVEGEEAVVIEANLDDLSPQVLAYALERLLAEGAREAFLTPVVMKKGRPGHLLTAVVPPGREGDLGALVVRETGTLGYRVRRVGRVVLRRAEREVAVPGGTVRVKTASLGGEEVRFGPEYEDCRRIARESGRPLREVIESVLRARR